MGTTKKMVTTRPGNKDATWVARTISLNVSGVTMDSVNLYRSAVQMVFPAPPGWAWGVAPERLVG